ncbi:MAG: hypothetical protein ACFFD7_01860 [Candidatus Thorarchaeota archaeon]
MRILKKIVIIGLIWMSFTISFLLPISHAQEITYEGADTENCPMFSLYPSEVYEYNITSNFTSEWGPEIYQKYVIVKGNISDYLLTINPSKNLTYGNGYSVWGDWYWINATSGEINNQTLNKQLAYWNESIGGLGSIEGNLGKVAPFLPVNPSDGKVNGLFAATSYFYYIDPYEHYEVYPNVYSFHIWNDSVYYSIKANYTEDGILLKSHYLSSS